jgi:hypothetical protein
MTNLFDKLNLRPFERRLIVVVGIVLFVAMQYFLIWPHFGDVKRMGTRRSQALTKLKTYRDEFAQTNKFAVEVKKLEGEGLAVPQEDQTSELMRTVQSQSAQAGVHITANSKPSTRTNQFFLELSQQVTASATEGSLVNFLYNLGAGTSLIRVRDLTLRPDTSRQQLNATIKVVASYQKNPPARAGAPAASAPQGPATAAPKPAPAKINPPTIPSRPSTPPRK